MVTRFAESQSVEILVAEESVPIQHYLRQPQRLINALVDPSRVEVLSQDCFRLKMRPLSFMMLKVQPVVDLKIWPGTEGTLHLKSTGCEILGVDYINQRFDLNLVGQLTTRPEVNHTKLWGEVDLEIKLELPPVLWMTPKSLIEATGRGLLRGILTTMKQRLMHQLVTDYRQWVTAQDEQQRPVSAAVPSKQSSLASSQSLA